MLDHLFKALTDSPRFVAGDKTLLREVLHPKNEPGQQLPFSIAHATVLPGERSENHTLHQSLEIYYLLSGTGTAHVDGIAYPMQRDDLLLIPAGAEQWIENTGATELQFLCIVAPPWSADQEEVEVAE